MTEEHTHISDEMWKKICTGNLEYQGRRKTLYAW